MSLHRNPRRTRHLSRRGSTFLTLVLVMMGLLISAGVVAYFVLQENETTTEGPLTAEVIRGDFVNEVVEAGEVESSQNEEIKCMVKSRNGAGTTIIRVVAEGETVAAGKVLVELDKSALELELQQEKIIFNNKMAARDQADNLFSAAKFALREYVGQREYRIYEQNDFKEPPVARREETSSSDGQTTDSPGDLALATDVRTVDDDLGQFHVDERLLLAERFVAEENKRRAEQYYRYSLNLAQKGYVTQQQLASDHFALMKAVQDLEAADIKLRVLQQHTKRKTSSQLLSDINNARAVLSAEESSVKVQDKRVKEIEAQIELCTIKAPKAGIVVYANVRDRRGNNDFVVEAGATVRERQTIIRLPDSDKMQVKAKISESKISLLDLKNRKEPPKAIVSIDAFDDMQNLEGVVTKVNDYPEPSSWFSSSVKEYMAYIKIKEPPEKLKTGLTAKVRIQAQKIPDALQVPIQAVHRHQGRYYCFVRGPLRWKAQLVSLGPSNEKFVVIEDGLAEGVTVARDPLSLLDEVHLPEAPAPEGHPETAARRKRPESARAGAGAS